MHKCLKKIPLYIIYSILFGLFISNPVFAETVDYSVTIEPSLTLTIPESSLVLNLDPSSKTFDSKSLNVSVGTNNKTGYKLTLSTPNESTDLERDTTSDTTAISATIPTLDTGTYTESTFTANKWGYSINSNTAIPSTVTTGFIPFTSGNTLMERDTAINQDQTNLTFASKIDYLQPAGAYNTTLQFNIVANPLVNYMQDLNPALCTTTPMTVVDKRDDQEYIIQRLADGNCWMMTNLNLGAADLTTDLTSENTNLTTPITAATFNGWKRTSGVQTETSPIFISVSGDDSVTQTPYGTLYNYCAISASAICANSNTSDATSDLCPAGWRLPTGGDNGEFKYLINLSAYNAYTKVRASIADGGGAFTLSGRFAATLAGPGSDGGFWSSARSTNTYMYDLRLLNNTVYSDSHDRYLGFNARCVLQKNDINQVTYLQEFATMPTEEKTIVINSMTTGTSYPIKDSRDNQEYTIAKLPDGNVWMTRNLAIGCDGTGSAYGSTITSKTLTSSDTNISAATWSTPTSSLKLGDSKTTPRMECSSVYGAWYNLPAATAGTIVGTSTPNNSTYDICPSGWRIQSNAEGTGIISYSNMFNAVTGGRYYGGRNDANQYGYWWSSTAYNATIRYVLAYGYNGTNLTTDTYNIPIDFGAYVRCIAK